MTQSPRPNFVSNNPNPWEMRHADAGRLITLSSALLGITATFAQDFVTGPGKWPLFGSWGALVAAIVFSIFSSGQAIRQARLDDDLSGGESTSSRLNWAFWCLLAGAILIATAAAISLTAEEDDIVRKVTAARSAIAGIDSIEESDLTIESLRATSDSGEYEITFNRVGGPKVTVVVSESGAVTSLEHG